MLTRTEEGFTLIEVIIAMMLLTGAVLGIVASAGRMIGPAGTAEVEFKALQLVEDRLSQIKLEPRYGVLDSLFAGSEDALPGLEGFRRTTEIERNRVTQQRGKLLEYTEVTVTVSGPGLAEDLYRKLILGAP